MYSPFLLLINRESVLPKDVKIRTYGSEPTEVSVDKIVQKVEVLKRVENQAGKNIKEAQKRQKRSYDSFHMSKIQTKGFEI